MEAMKQLTTLNDGPSAGWSFLVHNQSVRGAFEYEYIWRHGDKPMGCFIDWGYCMWDLSRMQAWHLIDDPDNGIKAEVDWWTDGRIRRETCEHCRYRDE